MQLCGLKWKVNKETHNLLTFDSLEYSMSQIFISSGINGTEIIFAGEYYRGEEHSPALFQCHPQSNLSVATLGWILLRGICLKLQAYSLFARMSWESNSSEAKYLQTLIHSTNIHRVAVVHKALC